MDEFFLMWLAMEQDIKDEQMTALEDYDLFDEDEDIFDDSDEISTDYTMDDENYEDYYDCNL